MKTILVILTFSALSLHGLRAEDAPATKDAPAVKDAPAAIELKNKSSFTMDASGRNPFWPIGWKPVARVQNNTTEHTGPDILPSAFVVSSITVDNGTRFAIINGKAMQEGQVFGLQLGTQTYQLTVKAIEDGRVILARRDQEIIVTLRRK
ncbi:MAG TPA: hypothetical protein VIM09_03865 [Chthoniobacterales bacterium]